jgi:hypothetical protein
METDPENPDAQLASRIRFATYERYQPSLHLTHVLKLDEQTSCATVQFVSGDELITRSKSGKGMALCRWNLASDNPTRIALPASDLSTYPIYSGSNLKGHVSQDGSRILLSNPEKGLLVSDLKTDAVLLVVRPDEPNRREFFFTDKGQLSKNLCLLPNGKRRLRVDQATISTWDFERNKLSASVPITRATLVKSQSILASEDGRRLAVLCRGEGNSSAPVVRILDTVTLAPTWTPTSPSWNRSR